MPPDRDVEQDDRQHPVGPAAEAVPKSPSRVDESKSSEACETDSAQSDATKALGTPCCTLVSKLKLNKIKHFIHYSLVDCYLVKYNHFDNLQSKSVLFPLASGGKLQRNSSNVNEIL